MSRVLITGARGFTGVHLRQELEQSGYDVVGTVFGETNSADEISLDITSSDQCRNVVRLVRPDFVVHLAGISFVQLSDPLLFYHANVIGTMNLLQALADENIQPRKILIPSSANVYGNIGGDLIDENQVPVPVSHYAVSKLAMEYALRNWFNRLPIIITRPFNYTGVGQEAHFLIPKIVSHFVQRRLVIELGNIDVQRDFSDVRVVVNLYRKLLECNRQSLTLNVCSEHPTALKEVVEMMEQIANYKIEIQVNPAFVRKDEVRRLTGNASLLRSTLGSIEKPNLRSTLEWMYTSAMNQPKAI